MQYACFPAICLSIDIDILIRGGISYQYGRMNHVQLFVSLVILDRSSERRKSLIPIIYKMLIRKLNLGLLLSCVADAFPYSTSKRAVSILPLSTKGRDILDANGNVFHYTSTNWPGRSLVMDRA
jgi:hypothetical protein